MQAVITVGREQLLRHFFRLIAPLVSEDGICLNHIIFVITKLKLHIIIFAKIRG